MQGTAAQQRSAIPAVRFRNVGKRFGETVAVEDVSLAVAAGCVHAFVGENGAGKSTLLGMLAGRIDLTEGEVEVFGQGLQTGHVRLSRAAGIVAIYQELTIVPYLSACANVFLGQTRSRFGFLSERAMHNRFNELCRRLEVAIPANIPAGELSVADQQIIEILRALQSEARILLLDEPTSALAPPEREALFGRIRELRASGVTVILVSHSLMKFWQSPTTSPCAATVAWSTPHLRPPGRKQAWSRRCWVMPLPARQSAECRPTVPIHCCALRASP